MLNLKDFSLLKSQLFIGGEWKNSCANKVFVVNNPFDQKAITTESEAITQANNTPSGLAAYAYTRNIDRAFRLSENLDAGMVSINTCNNFSPLSPFGGQK